jgi:hypothetical protein
MSKMTEKKFNEYKIINENGFKIDLNKLMYQFAHGDEYPQMRQIISNDNITKIVLTVSFFKFYDGSGEYTIKAEEYKINKETSFMVGGTGYFNKTYFEEKTIKGTRFNLNKIKELCNKFNMLDLKANILNDYAMYKGYAVNEISREQVAL